MTIDDLIVALGVACPVYVSAREFPAALVREAVESGLVAEWEDSPAGRAILLSSLATERLGLELADAASIEGSRWVRRGEDRPSRPSGRVAEVPDVAGDEPEPIDVLIAREEALEAMSKPDAPGPGGLVAALLGTAVRLPPPPTCLLGSTRPDWRPALDPIEDPPAPVGPRPAASPCPVCGGRHLTQIEGCLGCLRTGVDHLLPEVPDRERPRRKAPAPATKPAGPKGAVAGGEGRRPGVAR